MDGVTCKVESSCCGPATTKSSNPAGGAGHKHVAGTRAISQRGMHGGSAGSNYSPSALPSLMFAIIGHHIYGQSDLQRVSGVM